MKSLDKQDWRIRLKKGFELSNLLKYDKKICGGEVRIGDTRYRLSSLEDFIQSELDRQLLEILKVLEWRPKYGDENEINAFVRQIQIKIINLKKQ